MGKENIEDIVGKRIGIYDVIYECDFKSNDGHRMFHIRCSECGWESNIQMHQIKYKTACKHKNRFGKYIDNKQKWKNKRIYSIYFGILNRCYNKNEKSYRWYGAKGIKVCEQWIEDPASFEFWAINNGYSDNLTIDRINENKDYCPENCRWITRSNNAKYKSTTKITEVDGEKHTGKDWAKLLNLGPNTINKMLRENSEEKVKEFIRRRLKDLTKTRRSHQTWMNVYDLE